MSPERLLDHFERISDAPDAVPRLRRFILDLAVRGKLVEQDPNDEPASELLRRIQAEKTRLLNAGEIRKEKPIPLVEDNEASFTAPVGWDWVRIRQVTSDRGQMTPDNDFTYIDVTAINKETGCITDAKVLSASDAPSRARKLVHKGDVLYSCVRPYLLNIAVVESDIVPLPIASTAFAVLNGFGLVLSKYLWTVLRSPFMVECVEAKMRGQAYPAINDSDFALLLLPLPPLTEQHRIVAKVDELMGLCDRLEAAQAERESRRDKVVAASLYRLNNGADAEQFREHTRFHLRHLPRLIKRPEHIQQLRQTILNLAVRGKLVPQNPNDEPASELLGHRQLLLGSDKEPWKLPSGWAWSSFDLIGDTLGGGTPSKANPDFWSGSIPWVSLKDMKVDLIGDTEDHISELAVEQSSTRLIPTGSLLLVVRGMILAHSFPTAISSIPLTINQDMKAIVPFRAELIRMLLLVTKGLKPEVLRLVLRSTHGTCKLLTDDLFSLPLPIPPLAEQHRIVAKVDELMALCDHLEAQLTTTQAESCCLLEAVLSWRKRLTERREIDEMQLSALVFREQFKKSHTLGSGLAVQHGHFWPPNVMHTGWVLPRDGVVWITKCGLRCQPFGREVFAPVFIVPTCGGS